MPVGSDNVRAANGENPRSGEQKRTPQRFSITTAGYLIHINVRNSMWTVLASVFCRKPARLEMKRREHPNTNEMLAAQRPINAIHKPADCLPHRQKVPAAFADDDAFVCRATIGSRPTAVADSAFCWICRAHDKRAIHVCKHSRFPDEFL